MNGYNAGEERDKVLYAFHQECKRPTAEQILDWVRRFPQFAEDIRAHAAVGLDWAAREDEPALEASSALLERGYSNALNALYNAQMKTAPSMPSSTAAQSLHDIAAARGKEVFQIASEIDIGRSVIADLFNGWMCPPIRKRLVEAICAALTITHDMFDSAFAAACQNPRFGHAKANHMPSVTTRSCDEIIKNGNMTPERTRYWLEEG